MGWIVRTAVALALGALAATGAAAQAPLKIFDAHLHYNQEPNPYYDLDKVLEIFRRNNVTGILATSRPNKGTHQLMDAKAPGLSVVPFIRPYRHAQRHPDLVRRSGDLGADPVRIQARLLPRHRRVSHLRQGGRRRAGQEHRQFRGRARAVAARALRRGGAAAAVRAQPEGAHHLGAYRLFHRAGAREGAAGEVSRADGRAVLPRRHHARRRQARRRRGATCSPAIRTAS